MKNMKAKIPEFEKEDQEREFWATHSPLEYFDASNSRKSTFPDLKPSLKSVSIRLPEDLLCELKSLANKRDVPYQSLVKIFLARQIAIEREYPNNNPQKGKKIRSHRAPG
jgi:predicted DNA binding CopG/RHH family protein